MSGRALPLAAALALSLMLGACAGPSKWTKEGVSPDAAAADYADCRHAAQHDIQRDVNIDTDIAAARAQDRDRTQTRETYAANDASSNARLSSQIVKGCMESKGYAPSGPDAEEGPNWWGILNL
ncbi:MAG TPA: hypothetical protein VN632_10640 [Stellaceae bacterium]|nr:hypothetical protein [Stellaceae bacterium]